MEPNSNYIPFSDTPLYWELVEAQGNSDEADMNKISFSGPKGWDSYTDYTWHYLFISVLWDAGEADEVTRIVTLHNLDTSYTSPDGSSYEYREYTDELDETNPMGPWIDPRCHNCKTLGTETNPVKALRGRGPFSNSLRYECKVCYNYQWHSRSWEEV